jgi:hypothetical protein
MAGGGFVKLPGGSVVVALSLPRPPKAPEEGVCGRAEALRVRVLVHAANRARALTRLRNLGLRAVYLRGNAEPPTPDEITAVLHHPDGLVWRAYPHDDTESWHPIRTLLRPPAQGAPRRPVVRPVVPPAEWAWEGVLAEWAAAP